MTGDAHARDDLAPLPTSVETAIDLARRSEFLKRVIGDDRPAILLKQVERERDFVADQVTAVETERYLVNL